MFSDNSNVNVEILVHCKECIQIGKMTKMYCILYNRYTKVKEPSLFLTLYSFS